MGTLDSRGIYTPAVDEDGWDDELADNFALFATLGEQTAAITAALAGINTFSKGIAFYDSTVIAVNNIVAWRAPFACTVTAVRGWRVGGTGATVQAYRWTSGALPGTAIATSALSLSSTTAWNSTTTLSTTAFTAGQGLILGVLSVAGSPTQITVQVDFTRP